MTAKRKWKKMLPWIGGLVALPLILATALPFWFPWVLRPVAKKAGLRYASYVREGYARFHLESVSYTNGQTWATAARIQSFVPTVWVWRLLRSDDSVPYAEVSQWTISSNTLPDPPPSSPSTYTNLQTVVAVFGKVQRWLPVAVLTNGSLHLNGQTVSIDRLVWRRGKFEPGPQAAARSFQTSTKFYTLFYASLIE